MAILFAACVLASCTDDLKPEEYIKISRSSYTFSGDGDSVYVKVVSSGDWTVERDQAWIMLGQKSGDSIAISLGPNEIEEIRTGKVIFTTKSKSMEFMVEQLPRSFNGKLYEFPINARGAISPGGKYAAYLYWELDMETNAYCYYGKKINLETGEEYDIPSNPYDDYGLSYYLKIQAISDDGRTIVYSDDSNMIDAVFVDNNEVEMDILSGYRSPMFAAMSSDGTVIVGTVQSENQFCFVPAIWKNGSMELLEMPRFNSAGEPLRNGVIVRGCSQDGSVIYGSEWDYQGVIYWRDGKMFYPGLDYAFGDDIQRIYMYASYFSMSPDGKYIAASYGAFYTDYTEGQPTVPVLINTETDESLIFGSSQSEGGGLTADNNGILFGGTPATGMTTSLVYDFEAGTSIPISLWMKQKHGVTLSDSRKVYYAIDDRIYYGAQLVSTGVGTLSPEYVLVLDK